MTQLLKKINTALKKTEDIKSDIDGPMEVIYENVRNKELETILDRIKREPLDLLHFMPVLTSRDIPDRFFSYFIQLSEFLEESSSLLRDRCLVLVVQHFSGQLVDTSLALERTLKNWGGIGLMLYHRELANFLHAILKKAGNLNYSKSKEVLTNMCTAFNGMELSKLLHVATIIRKEYDRELIFKLSRLSKEKNLERIGYILGTEILQNHDPKELPKEDHAHFTDILNEDIENVPENLKQQKPRPEKKPK
jgi:hypothetical protein